MSILLCINLVVAVEQVIKSILDLAHSMDHLWDCMHSVVKQLPPSGGTLKRKPSDKKKSRANTFDMGNVGTIQRRLENITSMCE